MAKKKKNKHIMYRCNWHPRSYSEQARNSVKARIRGWEYSSLYNNFTEVLAYACNSYRCDIIKHRTIKGLRRYGKRKGLI
jgi:hypothetical protein